MSRSKLFGIALLFAPIALLSGCGSSPYEESEYAFQQETPLYTDTPGAGWDTGSDVTDVDSDGDGVPDSIDQDDETGNTGTGTGGWGRAKGSKSAISRYCKKHRCLAKPKYSFPGEWRAFIPKRIPDPAPELNSQVVYDDRVYVVVDQTVNARGVVTNVKLKQIGSLKANAQAALQQ